MSLEGKTLFITGASRGIGLAIALKAAKDGANIILAAKTAEPHPKLPGTIYTAADEIEKAGGMALPVIVDVREEGQVLSAVEEGVKKFGGELVRAGNILVRQVGSTFHAGTNVGTGRDYTLFSKVSGHVKFSQKGNGEAYQS